MEGPSSKRESVVNIGEIRSEGKLMKPNEFAKYY